MATRWTHVVLKVSDLERSIDFYRRFCGLEVARDGRANGGHTVWLAAPRRDGAPPPFVLVLYLHEIDARIDHLGFQCDTREEVELVAATAASLGILVEPPFDGGGDIGFVTQIRDPDGHRVEFTCGQPIAGLGG
jgi:catechol 2,3-dioxygenase-like lactoylglutathione lyase family enzyme